MVRRVALHCLLLLAVIARAEDAPDGSSRPLGDVVRQQKSASQHGKTARRVLNDDDIAPSHTHWMVGWAATTKIIPAIKISGLVPDGLPDLATTAPQGKQKIHIGFGPEISNGYSCADDGFDCAEQIFVEGLQRGGSLGRAARILFDSDGEVQGFRARVAHFEVRHEVQGRMVGTLVIVSVPPTVVVASCMYRELDRAEVEPQCDRFVSSLRIEAPKKFIYVEHNY